MIIRFFGGAQDLAGLTETSIEVESSLDESGLVAKLADAFPDLAPYLDRMRFAKNDEFTTDETRFGNEDQVDVLPPVAGGDSRVRIAEIRETTLDVNEVVRAVTHADAGAVASFSGIVRCHSEDVPVVTQLDYECHPVLGAKEMRRVLETLAEDFEGVRVAAIHRVGSLQVGEVAVVVAASAPHRAEAFAACAETITRIKASVPIWKKEWAEDGSGSWVRL